MKPMAVGLEFEEGICNFEWLHQCRKPHQVCKLAPSRKGKPLCQLKIGRQGAEGQQASLFLAFPSL